MTDASLDPSDILESLGLGGFARAVRATGGADTAIWRVEHGDATYALRLFRADQAAAMRREIAAMRAATDRGLPVPAIHGECIWRGRPALLLSWMPGRPLKHELCARPWFAWSLGMAFGRAQAGIHQTAAPPAIQLDSRSWIDWADPTEALRDRLRTIENEPETLLHLDYHPLNVLVAGRQVSAILDWTNAQVGDRRADLGRTASILHFAPIDDALPGLAAPAIRRWFTAGWRHGYREQAGPIHGMAPFYAWAGAVMVRDLSPRLGRPDLPWLTPALLERVQAWSDGWSAR